MLRHAFLRVGEDISLQHILLPPLSFCCFYLVLYCLLASTREARDGNNLLVEKYSVLENFLGQNIFSKVVALIV